MNNKNSFAVIKKPFGWFRRTRKRNKIIAVVVSVVVLMTVINRIQAATASPPYTLEKVQRGDIIQLVSETGNVNTAGRADVYSTATGIIEEIFVENGVTVQTGDELFHVRSTATPQEKASAYATYQSAVSAQKTAEQTKQSNDALMWQAHQALLDARNAQEYKNNHSKNPSTGNDYTQLEKDSIDAAVVQTEKNFAALESKVKEADVAITAASAQVTSSLASLQATQDVVVTAPTNGSVTNLSVFIGDKVTAGTTVSAAGLTAAVSNPPVLTIANLNDYSVRLSLNEVDIPKVTTGQKAVIELDALENKKFRGVVTHVDQVGTNTQGVVTYTVLVTISNPDPEIRPGMTASIDITVDRVANILTVPNSAIKPYKGGRAVRIVDSKTKELKFTAVQTGVKGETRTQIIKGLTEGQEIVTALSNDQLKRPGLF